MENSILYLIIAVLVVVFLLKFFIKKFIGKSFAGALGNKIGAKDMMDKATNIFENKSSFSAENATTNAQSGLKQISLSEVLSKSKPNTSGWMVARVLYENEAVVYEVVDNGIFVGYLLDIFVKHAGINLTDSIHPLGGLARINGLYVPKSHIQSFGRYTPLIVLFNPNNPNEIVVHPDHDDWHFEIN